MRGQHSSKRVRTDRLHQRIDDRQAVLEADTPRRIQHTLVKAADQDDRRLAPVLLEERHHFDAVAVGVLEVQDDQRRTERLVACPKLLDRLGERDIVLVPPADLAEEGQDARVVVKDEQAIGSHELHVRFSERLDRPVTETYDRDAGQGSVGATMGRWMNVGEGDPGDGVPLPRCPDAPHDGNSFVRFDCRYVAAGAGNSARADADRSSWSGAVTATTFRMAGFVVPWLGAAPNGQAKRSRAARDGTS